MSKTIIFQNQTGLHLRDGKVVTVLSAGSYRSYKFRNETIVSYPLYSQSYAYALHVRTAESAAISVELTVGVSIKNAEKMYLSGKTAYEVVSHAVARQLQTQAEAKTLNELLESGLAIDEQLLEKAIASYGLAAVIELTPTIRLPRNLQNAIDAQEVARQRAKADLEEARGRSAVIRHYANVAKVTKDNPDLLRLLLGQKAKSINVAFDASGKNMQ